MARPRLLLLPEGWLSLGCSPPRGGARPRLLLPPEGWLGLGCFSSQRVARPQPASPPRGVAAELTGHTTPNHACSPPSPGGDAPPSYSEVMGGMTGISNIRSGMQRVRESSNTESRAKGFWHICCSCCGSGKRQQSPVTHGLSFCTHSLSICHACNVTVTAAWVHTNKHNQY